MEEDWIFRCFYSFVIRRRDLIKGKSWESELWQYNFLPIPPFSLFPCLHDISNFSVTKPSSNPFFPASEKVNRLKMKTPANPPLLQIVNVQCEASDKKLSRIGMGITSELLFSLETHVFSLIQCFVSRFLQNGYLVGLWRDIWGEEIVWVLWKLMCIFKEVFI